MPQPNAMFELDDEAFVDDTWDPTGWLTVATSWLGLGTVGLVSLFQIIGLLS
jgi:hypothetical protein